MNYLYQQKTKNYDQLKTEMQASAESIQLTAQRILDMQSKLNQAPNYAECEKFPYEQLIVKAEDLPPGVNPNYREVSSTDDVACE